MARAVRSSVRARFATAVALAVALPLTLAACVSGNPASQDAPEQSGDAYSGEVEWWTINLQKNYGPDIQKMIDAYRSAHPDVTIKWVDVPGQDITTKLLASIASGNVPDAVNYTSATTGLFAGSMADLNKYFSAEELAAYAPGLAGPLVTKDGRRIAVPWYNGGTSLGFYNSDLLTSAGFSTAKPPKSYDDALALAKTYHQSSGKAATNFMAYSNVVQGNDIALLSEDRTKAAFNTAETVALLEKFKTSFDSGAIAPGSLGANQRELPQSLENRQIAFNPLATSSTLLNVEKNSPAVYKSIAVAPPVSGKSGKYYLPGQQVFGIPAKSGNQAAAAAWIKFVTSSEQQLALCKLVPIYPSTLKTLEDPFFTDISGSTPADQARKILRDTFGNSVDASLGSGNDEQLRELFDQQVRAFMSGTKSAQQALDAAETAWNSALAKGK
ncbi:ABC transporter substrate-binding protein [Kribbella italica]|uniref:Putative chitobiose transport system substrate-binding protein n=1 Tax=Kribbella italica TaxID=1540520 RepID=A0A7W9JCG5_9ACTN|nr:extracellular solute-binding protein [Kribbella italica]MBB5839573.1 putative chitobiose transport system substrate-binding protein [Kribbella italica]